MTFVGNLTSKSPKNAVPASVITTSLGFKNFSKRGQNQACSISGPDDGVIGGDVGHANSSGYFRLTSLRLSPSMTFRRTGFMAIPGYEAYRTLIWSEWNSTV